jgi:hypothetical protein
LTRASLASEADPRRRARDHQKAKAVLVDRTAILETPRPSNRLVVVQAGKRKGRATGGLAEPLRLENPTTIVRGDRVTHLVYDVSR